MPETYYEVLDVPTDASESEIQAAFRDKVKETHPDVSDDPDAEQKFKRVQKAKEVLTDEGKRARYDRLGHTQYVSGVINPDGNSNAGGKGNQAQTASKSRQTASTSTSGRSSTSTTTETTSSAGHQQKASGTGAGTRADWSTSNKTTAGSKSKQRQTAADKTAGDRHRGRWGNAEATYATRTPYTSQSIDTVRLSFTPRAIITVVSMFALYPVFVFASVFPEFPLPVNVITGICTLFVIGYLISIPDIGLVVFGSWSVLMPIALVVSGFSIFSLLGMIILLTSWCPLSLALLTQIALRV